MLALGKTIESINKIVFFFKYKFKNRTSSAKITALNQLSYKLLIIICFLLLLLINLLLVHSSLYEGSTNFIQLQETLWKKKKSRKITYEALPQFIEI